MAESNEQKQFTKDILKAKAVYRKRRRFIILSLMAIILFYILVQTILYINNKKELNSNLKKQEEIIANLDKENKVNEVVIDKLKDPYFISDLVRQEYGVSYDGEIIFNLPLKDKFMQTTIKSIMDGKIEKSDNGHNRLDDSKIPALKKEDKENNNSDGENKDKVSDTTESKNTSNKTTNNETSSSNSNKNNG